MPIPSTLNIGISVYHPMHMHSIVLALLGCCAVAGAEDDPEFQEPPPHIQALRHQEADALLQIKSADYAGAVATAERAIASLVDLDVPREAWTRNFRELSTLAMRLHYCDQAKAGAISAGFVVDSTKAGQVTFIGIDGSFGAGDVVKERARIIRVTETGCVLEWFSMRQLFHIALP